MTASLRPIGGDGVLARAGELVVLCALGELTDAALGAHARVAADGGDGAALAAAVDNEVGQQAFSGVVFGATREHGTAVAVFGHAWADVTTEHGEQQLALRQGGGGLRSVIPGELISIRAGLGDPTDTEPAAWADLPGGVVPAGGLEFVPAGTSAPPAPTPAPSSAPSSAPSLSKPAAAAPAMREPTPAEPVRADATLSSPPEPALEPSPEPQPDSLPDPLPAAEPEPPAGPLPVAVPADTIAPAPEPPPPAQPPPSHVSATADIDRGQPFESVVLLPSAGAPQVEARAPLPVVDAPLPAPAPDVAPAAHLTPDQGVQVLGVYCKNGHFDDPAARYCAVCGISMAQLTLIPRPGPRPPLGVLVLDDGSIFSLDDDYVVGRNPDRFDAVASGHARSLRVDDRQGMLSRAHAHIHLDQWQVTVVDLNSVNGTGVLGPGDPVWRRLPPGVPVAIRPGTEIGFGQRRMRYESHRNT